MRLLLIAILLITLLTPLYAQEQVIIKKEYYKFEYINEAKNTTTHDPRAEFFGWALIGTAYNSARWRIMKISYDYNDQDFRIEFADGNTSFDNSIYNYPTLNYQ